MCEAGQAQLAQCVKLMDPIDDEVGIKLYCHDAGKHAGSI